MLVKFGHNAFFCYSMMLSCHSLGQIVFALTLPSVLDAAFNGK